MAPGAAGRHTPQSGPNAFEKLVFGTGEDPLNLPDNMARYKRMLDACEAQAKVLGGTAAGLLGISSR